MTVLSVAQEVASVVGVPRPTVLFTSSSKTDIALRGLANRAKDFIISDADWQVLQSIHTITGDGSTEDWPLPDDYKRMTKEAHVWSSRLSAPFRRVESLDEWIGLDIQAFSIIINAWIIYGGQIHVKEALSSGETVKFPYIQNRAVRTAGGSNQANFTADDDTIRVSIDDADAQDERLLQLAMVWMWRKDKRLDYAQDFADYLSYKNDRYMNDRGSRVVTVGNVRVPRDQSIAYPQSIVP